MAKGRLFLQEDGVDRRWLGCCCEWETAPKCDMTTSRRMVTLPTGSGEASVRGESGGNLSRGRLLLLETIFSELKMLTCTRCVVFLLIPGC